MCQGCIKFGRTALKISIVFIARHFLDHYRTVWCHKCDVLVLFLNIVLTVKEEAKPAFTFRIWVQPLMININVFCEWFKFVTWPFGLRWSQEFLFMLLWMSCVTSGIGDNGFPLRRLMPTRLPIVCPLAVFSGFDLLRYQSVGSYVNS